jgi:3-oxoacyl-[acyl-carrier protein] reductase
MFPRPTGPPGVRTGGGAREDAAMTMLLADRAAVVTGAARGIGLACAELLAAHGATLTIADVDAAELDRVAASLRDRHGVGVTTVSGDLTDPAVPARLVDTAWESAGGALDILVNVAGYNLNARTTSMDDDTWLRMLDIHATAPFRVLRAAGPYFERARASDLAAGREVFRKIVNVSSIAVMGSAFQANYAAGKAAVVGLTKSLAKEWAPWRVNVNAVAFGSVDTRLTRPRDADNVADIGGAVLRLGMSARTMETAVADIPFGRAATAEEAAGGVFLLCTPWSNWVTGQLLVVSGGQVFGMSA